MPSNKHRFEFLTLLVQKRILDDGKFIDKINRDGFEIRLYYCENNYFVEAYIREDINEREDGEEIDFICLVPAEMMLKYNFN